MWIRLPTLTVAISGGAHAQVAVEVRGIRAQRAPAGINRAGAGPSRSGDAAFTLFAKGKWQADGTRTLLSGGAADLIVRAGLD